MMGIPFSKRDLVSSLVTGLITGVIVWRLGVYLRDDTAIAGIPLVLAVIVVPALWVLGVNLGYFLGRWFAFFNQFGRYAAVGFTNAAVDFGVFNLLYAMSGITLRDRAWFVAFKVMSFIVAALHSYFWNKTWAFDSASSHGGMREFLTFFGVTIAAVVVNTTVAYTVAQMYTPSWGIIEKVWANISLVTGSAVALVFSFVGFKMMVFKK